MPKVFEVVFQHEPDIDAHIFLKRARTMVEGVGFQFQYRLFENHNSIPRS